MRRVIYVAIAVFIFSLLSRTSYAQDAQFQGRVTDPQQKVVAGAEVRIFNQATGVERKVITNSDGLYSAPFVSPGTYQIFVQAPGFSTVSSEPLTVTVGQSLVFDVELKVGRSQQEVIVDAASQILNTTDASVSTVVDRKFVENMPLNGRSFQNLIALTPGVVLTPTSTDDEGQFSIAGQRAGSNYFTVDGVSANFAASNGIFQSQSANGAVPAFSALGSTASLVSVDALQEFRLETSTYAPEFGRESGGQIMLVTRSGTNHFHGTASEYLRNDVFDANDWFANNTGIAKPRERQNDFGGVFGGPIWKDKTFFFFSYEGLRVTQPKVGITDVPSTDARANAAPNIKALVDLFPLPNGPSTGPDLAQLAASVTNASKLDATSLRIDHAFSSKLTVFGRYNHAPSDVALRGSEGPPDVISTVVQKSDTGTLGVTAILSPAITNDFRANYSRARGSDVCGLDSYGGATVPPLNELAAPWQSLNTGWIYYSISSGRYSIQCAGPLANNVNRQINFIDTVEVSKGTHQLKFGFDFRQLMPIQLPASTGALYSWQTMPAFISGASPYETEITQNPTHLGMRFQNYSSFGQDIWKVSNRLTLTYGLRWDYNPPPIVTEGIQPLPISEITDLATATLLPAGSPLWHASWTNFAPRLGGTYLLRPNSERPTVLRLGFGQFYDLGTSSAAALTNAEGWFPYSLSNVLCLDGVGSGCNLSVPYTGPEPPFVFTQPYPPMRAFDPHLKLPYSLEWSAAVEQSITQDQTFKITYVGSAGRRLLRDDLINNPNPIFSGLFLTRNSSYSNYDALQFQFQRRLSHGLQALISYSWSHSLDLNSADVTTGWNPSTTIPTTLYNIHQDYGNSDFDIRNSFTAALTYNLPGTSLQNPIARAVLERWSIDSINSARTGTPFNVLYQPNTSEAYKNQSGQDIQLRPNQVPAQPVWIPDPGAPTSKSLNLAAFTISAVLQQGSEGRNTITGFPLVQLDLGIRRQFQITEQFNLQFRAEGFNVINHPNFGNPLNNIGTCSLGVQCTPVYGWGTSQAMLNQSMGATGTSYATPFGSLYQVGGPRSLQLSIKLQF